jgi:hypothetical protein
MPSISLSPGYIGEDVSDLEQPLLCRIGYLLVSLAFYVTCIYNALKSNAINSHMQDLISHFECSKEFSTIHSWMFNGNFCLMDMSSKSTQQDLQ